MRAITTGALLALALAPAARPAAHAQEPTTVRGTPNDFKFDADKPGKPPVGFVFGRTKNLGKPGQWLVRLEKDAPSPGNVLAQLDPDDTSARYPLAVTAAVFHGDVRVSVKCKAISGDTDQACGVVFRYVDENNYYLARSNVIEENVRLYHVKDGKRTQLASWDGKVPGKAWNEVAAEAKGESLRVFFNGQKVLEVKDRTFRAGGRAGMWTKADSVTYFDDFNVTSI